MMFNSDDKNLPVVALVGRPNVGKSTLFNRLVGKRIAIVHDQPGVTRDWRVHQAGIGDLHFTLVDMAGLDEHDQNQSGIDLAHLVTNHALEGLQYADIICLMIDGKMGLHPLDEDIAAKLRKMGKPIILLVNKSEGRKAVQNGMEAYGLGLGEPVLISAEHGEGMADLYDALSIHIQPVDDDANHESIEEFSQKDEAELLAMEKQLLMNPLKLAIVGRPNVGKSTLVNHLAGAKRVLTGPMAGLTRDAIYVNCDYEGKELRIVDTAGLRRKSKRVDALEKFSANSTRQAIELAEICVLVLSAEDGMEKQDLAIAGMILEEGRGLVIAINKSDLVYDRRESVITAVKERLHHSLPQAKSLPVVMLSAEKGKNIAKLLQHAHQQREIWHKRLPTAKLNEWLKYVLLHHPPPAVRGRRPKPRYISQIKSRPPSFALFGTRVDLLPESWQRYLINQLRADFDLPGVPLRLSLRPSGNPYDKRN